MKLLLKDPSFSGVSAGSRATAILPTGWTYNQIHLIARKASGVLMTGAEIAASVGKIYLKKDGVAFIDGVTAAFMRQREEFFFASKTAGLSF